MEEEREGEYCMIISSFYYNNRFWFIFFFIYLIFEFFGFEFDGRVGGFIWVFDSLGVSVGVGGFFRFEKGFLYFMVGCI